MKWKNYCRMSIYSTVTKFYNCHTVKLPSFSIRDNNSLHNVRCTCQASLLIPQAPWKFAQLIRLDCRFTWTINICWPHREINRSCFIALEATWKSTESILHRIVACGLSHSLFREMTKGFESYYFVCPIFRLSIRCIQ